MPPRADSPALRSLWTRVHPRPCSRRPRLRDLCRSSSPHSRPAMRARSSPCSPRAHRRDSPAPGSPARCALLQFPVFLAAHDRSAPAAPVSPSGHRRLQPDDAPARPPAAGAGCPSARGRPRAPPSARVSSLSRALRAACDRASPRGSGPEPAGEPVPRCPGAVEQPPLFASASACLRSTSRDLPSWRAAPELRCGTARRFPCARPGARSARPARALRGSLSRSARSCIVAPVSAKAPALTRHLLVDSSTRPRLRYRARSTTLASSSAVAASGASRPQRFTRNGNTAPGTAGSPALTACAASRSASASSPCEGHELPRSARGAA